MTQPLEEAARRAIDYLEGLAERPVAPSPAALAGLEALAGALPESGSDTAEIVDLLDRVAAPATVASAGPRYFGFVTGGTLPASLAANWLAGAWDQNTFSAVSSPLGARIEAIALGWVVEALDLPRGSGGGFVTGATMANLAGLAAARHRVLGGLGWKVEDDGLFGAPPITVVVGAEVHVSLLKALGLLGLGRERVVRVPTDGQGRMRADALPALTPPTIVCLQAGNVNTGAFDPADSVIPLAKRAGAWVHVDGAFGLWARAAPALAPLAAGFEAADSWALDGHKWLNVPYDCGIALVREAAALAGAMSVKADYLARGDSPDPFDFTPECSRRMRGIEVWAALKSLGRRGLAAMIEGNCRAAARFAEGLARAGFAVLNEVALNQVLVAFGDDAETERVIAAVQADGTLWAGGTTWHGRRAMRISVSSWATGADDVETSLAAIRRIAGA